MVVLKSLERGPLSADMIEAALKEKRFSGEMPQDLRVEEVVKALYREGKIESATAGGTRIYMLTEAGLAQLLAGAGEPPTKGHGEKTPTLEFIYGFMENLVRAEKP